jgi:hypothetical protein
MATNIIIIACSIFKNEIEHLKTLGKIKVPVVYINSMLHMVPRELQQVLDEKLDEYKRYKIVLVFGDCHARMVDYEKNKNVVRTQGINCCEILMGTDSYKRVRKEGAFILLPEWADRWTEVFMDYMGFKRQSELKSFMTDMHKKLVYVDTGFQKRNTPLLNQISEYTGLPLEIHQSTVAELERMVTELIENELKK